MDRDARVVRELVGAHGRTYAEEAGIRLRDTPQPLYRLMVLAHLLSARIRGSVAVATARALREAGLRDPRRMAGATWQERVDALGRGGYRRYD
ncbi:endonuclease, partial [Streptomyces sp. TRM76130]|nr:endonuclease [Streptomyces sp. TRM76130]